MKNEYTIDFCRGSNSGAAIYVNDESGGHRLFGSKCYGGIKTVRSIKLTKIDCLDAIRELERIREEMMW